MTVGEVCTYLQGRAFETAGGIRQRRPACRVAGYAGLPDSCHVGYHPAAVRAAEEAGADLIVSHHPVIFSPLKRLDTGVSPTVWPGRGSPRSVSIPISTGRPAGSATFSPFAWSWTIYKPRPTASAGSGARRSPGPHGILPLFVGKRLGTPVRLRAGTGPVKRVAVCGGAGGDFLLPLLKEGGARTPR